MDENGQRIPDGKGGWKNHREDTTDWNDKGNVEIWRAAWAAYTNRALESAGRPERIDHRSYKRQGIDKIPSVHLGPAASQMEKRGIRTDKGEVNRQIAADNKLLKEIKARITRLYRWSKAEAEKPQTQQSSLTALWETQQQLNAPRTRTGKIRALQESAALFSFLQMCIRDSVCMAALTVFLLVCGNSASAVVLILIVWALILLLSLIHI